MCKRINTEHIGPAQEFINKLGSDNHALRTTVDSLIGAIEALLEEAEQAQEGYETLAVSYARALLAKLEVKP